MGNQENQARKVMILKEWLEEKEIEGHQGTKDSMGLPVKKAKMPHLEKKVFPAHLDNQDFKDHRAAMVKKVQKVHQEIREKMPRYI